jgi:putative flippase GtrA
VKRLINYGFVGLAAFTTEFLSFIVLIELLQGIDNYLILAQTVSFSGGLLISFIGSRQVTFKHHVDHYHLSIKQQLGAYVTLALFNLLISNVLLHYLVYSLHAMPLVAKVCVMASVVLWNYLIFTLIIFRSKKP